MIEVSQPTRIKFSGGTIDINAGDEHCYPHLDICHKFTVSALRELMDACERAIEALQENAVANRRKQEQEQTA